VPAAARDNGAVSAAPTLWRALRANGQEAFYLIGSVHLATPEMLRFPSTIDEAYRRSAELVLEIDANGLRPEVAARLAERYARIAPPATLRERVSPATLAALSRYLAAHRESLARYLQLQPWFIAQQI